MTDERDDEWDDEQDEAHADAQRLAREWKPKSEPTEAGGWVLWEQRSSQTTDRSTGDKITSLHNYYIEDAFTSHEACASARDKAFVHNKHVVGEIPGIKDFRQNQDSASFTYTRENTAYVLKYLCLPDTIDPREKK